MKLNMEKVMKLLRVKISCEFAVAVHEEDLKHFENLDAFTASKWAREISGHGGATEFNMESVSEINKIEDAPDGYNHPSCLVWVSRSEMSQLNLRDYLKLARNKKRTKEELDKI